MKCTRFFFPHARHVSCCAQRCYKIYEQIKILWNINMFVLKRICTPVCWVDFLLANGRPAVSDRFLQSQIHWPVIKKTSWIAYIFNRMCTSLFHIWFQFVLSPPLDVQSGLKTGSLWCGRSEIFFLFVDVYFFVLEWRIWMRHRRGSTQDANMYFFFHKKLSFFIVVHYRSFPPTCLSPEVH